MNIHVTGVSNVVVEDCIFTSTSVSKVFYEGEVKVIKTTPEQILGRINTVGGREYEVMQIKQVLRDSGRVDGIISPLLEALAQLIWEQMDNEKTKVVNELHLNYAISEIQENMKTVFC